MSGFFQQLDGSATHKDFLVPFDAHDKVLRGSPKVHTLSAKGDPVPIYQYPKAVAHNPETGEPVIAKDEKHEAELTKKKEKSA